MSGKKFTDLGNIKAFLGVGTEFEGLLSFEGTVRIDGVFKGEIQTKDCLIIGDTASVHAEIKAGRLVIMGKLDGNVVATSKVEISSTGHMSGDLSTPSLMIEEGAKLEGNVHMETGSAKVVNISGAATAESSGTTVN